MARILVVDNETMITDLVREILGGAGYEVLAANSGAESLEKVGRGGIDLVLLDIIMPDMSGWDVYQKIRQKDRKMKVAFLSIAEVTEERKRALMKEGLSDFINKPFTPTDLVQRVKKILG